MNLTEIDNMLNQCERFGGFPLRTIRKTACKGNCISILGIRCEIVSEEECEEGIKYIFAANKKLLLKMKEMLEKENET